MRINTARLAWIPAPALFIIILILWSLDIRAAWDPPLFLISINFIFSTVASLLIACLVARSFWVSGKAGLLMLGCGAVIWSGAGFGASIIGDKDANLLITIHNSAVWLSAAFHMAGVLYAVFFESIYKKKFFALVSLYGVSLLSFGLIAFFAVSGWMPIFFIQGSGGSPIRQTVLGSAVFMFATTSLLLRMSGRKSQFAHLYSQSLLLIAIGLFGVLLEPAKGCPLSWAGRIAQYLGGVYMLMAGIVSVRETGGWEINTDEWDRKMDLWDNRLVRFLTPSYIWSLPGVWRYLLAIGLSILTTLLRMAAIPILGNFSPYAIGFPAIAISTAFLGFGPGLLSTLLVIGSGEAFIIEASFSQVAALRLAVSLASGILLSSIMHAIRVAQIRAVQHEARLTSFAKAAFEGIVESREGIIIDCNQQFADLAGCSISELKGSAISNLIALEDRNRVVENLIRNQESVIEHGIVRKDGSRLTVEAHGQPLIEGSDTRFAAVRDITERKIAESKLRDANIVLEKRVQERTAELAQRAAKLQALAGELTLAEQRERSRLAKILHDHLQQLLVAAKFRLTVLSKGEAGYIEVEELIDESIAASRSLTAELSPPILYEAGLTAGVKWLARRMAEKQGLSVELQVEESGSMPEHLKVLLFESIRELLFNVVKHAGTRSATVQLRHTKDSLQVVVADRGVGFDPALMPQPGEGGRGFGLFSIRERLELVGGEFEIRSAPNHGCRIALTVSLLQQGVHERSLTSSPIAEPSNHEPARANAADKTIRVLLADDHGIMREGMARVLGQEPDIQIVGQAADGIEAIKMADELLPQVILMDLSMPNLNGIDATRAIHGRHPEIHIIGLSMFEESDSAKAMRDAGAIAYLTKSGPPENLVSTIRQFGRPAAIAALISAD